MKIINIALLFTLVTSSALAKNKVRLRLEILSKKEIAALLGEKDFIRNRDLSAEVDILLDYQNERTQEECRVAASQDRTGLKKLFVENGGPLTEKEAKSLRLKMAFLYPQVGYNILKAKNLYEIPRPYDSHSVIEPCIPKESSYAYPSGHTTLARVIGRVLSEVYPERAALFMKRANEVSENRMIGGVHYPSDVAAGKLFGDAISELIIRKPSFQKIFAP